MVRAGEIVANRLRAVVSHKHSTGVLHKGQYGPGITHGKFKMLGRNTVGHADGIRQCRNNNDGAPVNEGTAGDRCTGKTAALFL